MAFRPGRRGGLLAPAALYAGVHLLGWRTPALGGTGIAFDPLAWQVLFLGGAWLGRRSLLERRAIPRRRVLTALAIAVLAFGLCFRLVEYGWTPGPALDTAMLVAKERLALPRVLHALALAYLVAAWIPRDAAWMRTRPALGQAAAGRHSLHVFCIGLFLSWSAATVSALMPGHPWWLDPLLIATGAAALIVLALAADHRRTVAARAT